MTGSEALTMKKRRLCARWGGLALAATLLLTACGSPAEDEEGSAQPQGTELRVTLGTKDFTEEFILGELYRQALAQRGYKVTLRKNIGSTEIIDQALQRGEIDGYPEYLGVAATVVARQDVVGKSAEQTYDIARRFYATRGQVLSRPTRFEDVDAIATTQLFAQENRLRTLEDLRRLESFTLGARPEFATRVQGLKGMQQLYDLTNAEFKPLAIGSQYTALDEGDVDTANVFTTDAQLSTGDYRVLEDPKRLFGYQHVALVIDDDKLERLGGDRFLTVINDVNRLLTNDTMLAMNRAVELDGQDEANVAARFLRESGLIRARP
jgi:osmoprotectant transport system substrate-binding protein